jgi:hypothetical protein
MDMLLTVGEVYLIIGAIAATFYIMIGMNLADRTSSSDPRRRASVWDS